MTDLRTKQFAAHVRSSCGLAASRLSISLYPEHRNQLFELSLRYNLGLSALVQIMLEAEEEAGWIDRIIRHRLRARRFVLERTKKYAGGTDGASVAQQREQSRSL
jgi:hypothetical protein